MFVTSYQLTHNPPYTSVAVSGQLNHYIHFEIFLRKTMQERTNSLFSGYSLSPLSFFVSMISATYKTNYLQILCGGRGTKPDRRGLYGDRRSKLYHSDSYRVPANYKRRQTFKYIRVDTRVDKGMDNCIFLV